VSVLAIVVLLCLVVVGLAGAAAAPSTAGSRMSLSAAPAVAAEQAGLVAGSKGRIPPPPGKNNDYGIQFDPITSHVQRAKVSFSLPPLTFRSYLTVCFTTPTFSSPCPGHDLSIYPKLNFNYTWDVAFADNWVAVRSAGEVRYGVFPPVRVSTLAFGAIPVSATVRITQTVHNGLIDPMKLLLPIDIAPIPPGKSIPGFGAAPKFSQGVTFFSFLGVIEGTVNIALSDLTVDRVPVDVGAGCRTAAPAQLRLLAPAGYYPQNVPPQKLKGKPGEFQPLAGGGPAGYLQGTVDVPSFTGCVAKGDDLDPLITAMVSGAGDPVDAYSPHGLQSWCLERVANCSRRAAAAQRLMLSPLAQLRTAMATPSGRAALRAPGGYVPPRAAS
jgi:hypothetical protein